MPIPLLPVLLVLLLLLPGVENIEEDLVGVTKADGFNLEAELELELVVEVEVGADAGKDFFMGVLILVVVLAFFGFLL